MQEEGGRGMVVAVEDWEGGERGGKGRGERREVGEEGEGAWEGLLVEVEVKGDALLDEEVRQVG